MFPGGYCLNSKTIIKHLSLGVVDPKRAADALAELTHGNVRPFHPVKGAFVCLWPDWNGQFIEFYPKNIRLVPTSQGADFKSFENDPEFSSTHVNLETDLTGDTVKAIAARYNYEYYFRPKDGGPLHEIWIENTLLVELVTKDLR